MDIQNVRRSNLRNLIDQHEIAKGNVSKWCEVMKEKFGAELNPNFIRQLVPKRVAEADRNFGEKAARKLEGLIRLPSGYLDQEDGKTIQESRLEYATLSDEEIKLVHGYRACDERGRHMLLMTAQAAIESSLGNTDTGPSKSHGDFGASQAQEIAKTNPADLHKKREDTDDTAEGGTD